MRNFIELILTIIILFFMILFSRSINDNSEKTKYFGQNFEDALILDVKEESLQEDEIIKGSYIGNQLLEIKILTGKYKSKTFDVANSMSTMHNIKGERGQKVIVSIQERENQDPSVWIYNYKRSNIIFILGGIFFAVLVILGGFKGFRSFLSLIVTGGSIIFLILPLIFKGYNPVWVSITVISFTTVVSFLFIAGINRKSFSAILGTVFGIIIAGIVAYTAGKIANLSGVTMEKGQQIVYLAKDYRIKINGLMFSAILISSLGAVMDVAMSIVSSVFEIHDKKPDLHRKELFLSAMNIGKDVMGTMSNTLILAFAGGSLNLMLLIYGYSMQTRQFLNLPALVTEAIHGFAGSLGIILTVPISALVSVFLIKNWRQNEK